MHTVLSGMVSALHVSRGEALREKTFGHVAGRHLDHLSKSNTKAYNFAWYQNPLLIPPSASQRRSPWTCVPLLITCS